jgi:hypothetical protein
VVIETLTHASWAGSRWSGPTSICDGVCPATGSAQHVMSWARKRRIPLFLPIEDRQSVHTAEQLKTPACGYHGY